MLSVNTYDKTYVDACRAGVDAQLAVYRLLVKGIEDRATVEAFERLFFRNMILVLDGCFVHRSRTMELKDGNPLNEVRVLCNSILQNDGELAADKTIKLRPESSVLHLHVGDEIVVNEAAFDRLSDAFFAEIEKKYV